jgi:hypothetical protein
MRMRLRIIEEHDGCLAAARKLNGSPLTNKKKREVKITLDLI